MLLPDWIVLYMAIAAGGAFILGQRRIGVALALPAVIRWAIFPLIWPALQQIQLIWLVVALPVVVVFGGLLIMGRTVSLVYGPRASGHVTGTYLVRVFDLIAAGTLWVIAAPFRIVFRSRGRQ